MKRTAIYFILFLICSSFDKQVIGQTDSTDLKQNRIAIVYGSGFIPGASLRPNALFASIPKLGVVYERRISTKFGASLMSDVELISYTVNEGEADEFEREGAWSTCVLANLHVGNAFVIFAGAGYEIEASKDQAFGRFGFQYMFFPGSNWDISPIGWADLKEENSAYVLGINVGRTF